MKPKLHGFYEKYLAQWLEKHIETVSKRSTLDQQRKDNNIKQRTDSTSQNNSEKYKFQSQLQAEILIFAIKL